MLWRHHGGASWVSASQAAIWVCVCDMAPQASRRANHSSCVLPVALTTASVEVEYVAGVGPAFAGVSDAASGDSP